jgi:F-type H+-transporting ATPase subunit b
VELSWTTFVLEAINFLVLVWLLKRLFYAPVKRAISQRRAAVEKTLRDVGSARRDAEDLKARYEGRVREWEVEKERQREEFRKELSEEKTRQLKIIENLVAMEREKAEAQEEKQAAERRAKDEKEAMKHAMEFTSRLLRDLASPELEGKIVEMVIKHISSATREALPGSAGSQSSDRHVAAQVRSAHSLTEPQRVALAAILKQRMGNDLTVTFETDQRLLAGLEIAVGAYVLRANLRDELEYFSTGQNHEQQ